MLWNRRAMLPGSLMEVRDKAEAVEWSKRFLGVLRHGESTIWPVY